MACSNPMPYYRKDDWLDTLAHISSYIPCGRCLNCRVDRINQYTYRCEKELIDRRSGAFVTFTYDDVHIQHLMRKDKNGKDVATLSRDDSRRFLYRLNKEVKKNPNNVLCQHDFKYILSGEYGDHGKVFDRPHFHALFFGLDFAFCQKIFARAWRGQGSIKVLPITNGAPRYILDYISTLEYGELRRIKYDDNNISAPFQVHSLGLGSSLFFEQLDYIRTHNNCFRWHGKDVPIPPYWRDKFLLPKNNPLKRWKKVRFQAIQEKAFPYEQLKMFDKRTVTLLHDYQLSQTKVREDNLTKKARYNGRSVVDTDKLTYDLHEYHQHHNMFYRSIHPTLSDLNLTSEEATRIAMELPAYSINQLAELALYGDLVPF